MMEPTVTQNSALYYAQHKSSKQRAALFRKLGALARKRRPDARQDERLAGELFLWPRCFGDNRR
jgi:hypothetical protein